MKKPTRQNDTQKTLSQLYDEFQMHNKVKNLSAHSIRFYENVNILLKYLQEQNIAKIQNVTSDIVDGFILHLQKEHENSVTVNTYLRGARVFLYWCMEKEYLLPSFRIRLIKQEEKLMKTYSDADMLKLLKKPNLKKCKFVEHRNWLLVNYFVETGNRLQSVINIKVSDVKFDEKYLVLRKTKNRTQQIVPLTKTLMAIMPEYIQLWNLSDDDYLFPSYEGSQLSENSIKLAITRYNKSRGVTITSIHAFRHTMAKNFIKTGGGAFQLQTLLGHKDLTMTKHYVQLFSENLQRDVDEHSIVERLTPSRKHITRQK